MKLNSTQVDDLKYRLDSLIYHANFIKHARELDPISLVYPFQNKLDIEVAAFIVSTLSYGRQTAFLPVLKDILSKIGGSPAEFIASGSEEDFQHALRNFKVYRFTAKDDLLSLFQALKTVYTQGFSLEDLFTASFEGSIKDALQVLVEVLKKGQPKTKGLDYLLPEPNKGSSCKRLNMFLRWMVRFDLIDLGIWTKIPKSALVIPLDTHVFKVSRELGLTERKDNSWKTAEDVTESLRCLDPNDPVKYDFALCTSKILKKTL